MKNNFMKSVEKASDATNITTRYLNEVKCHCNVGLLLIY